MTPAASVKDASSSWVKKKTNLSNQSEVDYKKLALVNDDLLKVMFHFHIQLTNELRSM